MERSARREVVFRCLKVLGLAYMVSALMLLLLAVMVYKFDVSEKVVSIGIILVYIVSCLLAGLVMGKLQKNRRFLWGIFVGAMYFAVLLILTGMVGKDLSDVATDFVTTLLLCLGSGMLGGMVG